jgi:hypothetical protein
MENIIEVDSPATRIESEDTQARELPTYYPLLWFHLPEGPKRDALRLEQEKPGYKFFNR